MSHDPTESARRAMLAAGQPLTDLEATLANLGERWDTDGLRRDFTVHAFLAPFCTVTRRADGARGTLEFTHSPRWYFNFVEDSQ